MEKNCFVNFTAFISILTCNKSKIEFAMYGYLILKRASAAISNCQGLTLSYGSVATLSLYKED